jgi:hypothetical protein
MACSAVKIEIAPNDLHEERVPPTLKCCARAALKSEITWVTGAVTKGAGATFLCNVSVPVLGSLTRPLGDRGLFCAVSLPDKFADSW